MRSLYRILPLCLGIIMGGIISATQAEENSPAPISEREKAQLRSLLPEPSLFNAVQTEKPQFFDEETLYEYINGAAESFHQYDFENLISAQYKAGEVEITIDIYNMGTLLNAFGIYSIERSPDLDFIPIGTQGTINPYGLNFLHGPYYVKLAAFGPDNKLRLILVRFARSVSGKIGEVNPFPHVLQSLPKDSKVENSEQYLKVNPLGYSFLNPVVTATYRWGDEESVLAIFINANAKETGEKWNSFKKHFDRTKAKIEAVDDLTGAFRVTSEYEGEMIVYNTGRFTIILRAPQENAVSLLQSTRKQLMIYAKD